ncbi:MAG: cytochrome c [Anaerolineae bacterium]|nr:cytochrome c [Anaerolineae bacterium]
MIPPPGVFRRIILTFAAVGVLFTVPLIFLYDVIKINWRSNMEIQISVKPQEGPRKWAPADAVSFEAPSLPHNGELPTNPVAADPVSLVRGKQLYGYHCAACHGPQGKGDGPVTQFWKADAKRPANLTEPRIGQQTDGALYLTIAQGFGVMPPLRENLSVRERWDIVNYVRTLGQ